MVRHLLVIITMLAVSIIGLNLLCRAVDPSRKYSSEVEFNYARFCAGCHGPHGEGNGRIGRFKKLEPADFTTIVFWSAHSNEQRDEQLVHSIAVGKDDMPSFSFYLTHEEQRELLTFIKTQFRPTSANESAEELDKGSEQ